MTESALRTLVIFGSVYSIGLYLGLSDFRSIGLTSGPNRSDLRCSVAREQEWVEMRTRIAPAVTGVSASKPEFESDGSHQGPPPANVAAITRQFDRSTQTVGIDKAAIADECVRKEHVDFALGLLHCCQRRTCLMGFASTLQDLVRNNIFQSPSHQGPSAPRADELFPGKTE
jgi:hypothetical protein